MFYERAIKIYKYLYKNRFEIKCIYHKVHKQSTIFSRKNKKEDIISRKDLLYINNQTRTRHRKIAPDEKSVSALSNIDN